MGGQNFGEVKILGGQSCGEVTVSGSSKLSFEEFKTFREVKISGAPKIQEGPIFWMVTFLGGQIFGDLKISGGSKFWVKTLGLLHISGRT